MLRLEIDGKWEPEDFIEVLTGVESLYYKAALIRRFPYEPPFYSFERSYLSASFDEQLDQTNNWLLARARATARVDYRMKVARISYASPGGIDLAGLGQACNALKGIIDSLIKFFTEGELRRQADEQAKIETSVKETELERDRESLRTLKIKNARAILNLRRDFHDVPEDVLVALIGNDQDRLVPRIAERKLIGIQRIDGDSHEDDGDER
ncbi:hypothetical protein [Acidiphilium iwatense]|uniref:Uncharacterized protein n=1 Tax=Acidiphilium iwatense TaxID=768198 RepID=A0ABS9DX22_9PROT|nr:hypothetical protein [Acidiphilium iwatense]MCF3947229.1 hypothetical protein [Acidiphilium iwatense]